MKMMKGVCMIVKFKKLHENAVLPSYAKEGDAGLDLTCVNRTFKEDRIIYDLGIAVEIPQGYVGYIFPRSSVCKKDLSLCNCVGVIDSGYRGEVKAFFNILHENPEIYEIGDRIGQMIIMPVPKIEPVFVDELSDSERGTGGFGSSGK